MGLQPHDIFVVYSDGVTDSTNQKEEEFGEERLTEAVRASRSLQPSDILSTIMARVREFSYGPQADDLTLVVARAQP